METPLLPTSRCPQPALMIASLLLRTGTCHAWLNDLTRSPILKTGLWLLLSLLVLPALTVAQTYNPNGTTIAGTSGVSGNAANRLSTPNGVFVTEDGVVYVADTYNNRVQKWAVGATSGITVAGGNGLGSAANQLSRPTKVFVDGAGAVYVADADNYRVQKWAAGATSGATVAGGRGYGSAANQLTQPNGVYVDGSGTVYVTDYSNNRVQKWAAGALSGTTIASVSGPTEVFVDGAGAVYVAGGPGNSVQKWGPGATTGITVAGGNGAGAAANQLNFPQGLCVDGSGAVYVADTPNHRIQKWAPGATTGITVAGGTGAGAAVNQLNNPFSVSIDGTGAMYVADANNHRVQKFSVICSAPLPTRLYVNARASGANTGLSWNDAFTSLQSALTYACAGNLTEIWVAAGTYKPTTGTDRNISFAMRPGVAVYGGFIGFESLTSSRPLYDLNFVTVLSGDIGTVGNAADNSYHVINNPAGLTNSAILDGFVITGGNANGSEINQDSGGGMYNNGRGAGQGCSPLIRNCTFKGNSASLYGGAMFNSGYSSGTSSPTLTNCSFQANMTSYGGAMYNYGTSGASSPVLTNCSFQANTASQQGGAMFNSGYSGTSSPVLTNCSFQANTASKQGGAIYNGGIAGTSNPTLTNCVLFGNGGANTFANDFAFISANYSLFDASVTGYSGSTGNLTTTTSPFLNLTSTDLNKCSPAINAGFNAAPGLVGIATALGFNNRIFAGRVDMGAYEYLGTPFVAITTQPRSEETIPGGKSAGIFVGAIGDVTGYQWYKDGNALAGKNQPSILIDNAQASQAGRYYAVVKGACNTVTSTDYVLSIAAEVPLKVNLTASPAPLYTKQTMFLKAQISGGRTLYRTTFSGPGIQRQDPVYSSLEVNNLPVGLNSYSVIVSDYSLPTKYAEGVVTVNVLVPPPTVNSPVPTQATTVGSTYSLPVGNVFSCCENSVQNVRRAALADSPDPFTLTVSGLPDGLTFTPPGTISGVPSTIGVSIITLTATNESGLSVSTSFYLTVGTINPKQANTPPIVTRQISPKRATVGLPYPPLSLTEAFTDIETPNQLILSATGLPTGFNLSPSGILDGTPSVSGVSTVTVTATDPDGLLASNSFLLSVNPTPPPLSLTTSVSQTPILTTGNTTIRADVSGGTVPYSYSFSGPGIIGQSSGSNVADVSGLPAGVHTFTIRVSDGTATASQSILATVAVTVTVPNTDPVAVGNPNQSATVNTAFSYIANAFFDNETPNGLTYSALIDQPNDLAFDPFTRTVSGIPGSAGVSSVTITATDPGGRTASTSFNITAACPVVNVGITPTLQTVSAGQSAILTASGADTYAWSDAQTTAQITVSPTITTLYSVTGTISGCLGTAMATVVWNGPPRRLYVKGNAGGANTGLSWADAFTDLQSALTYTSSAGLTEIWVAAGMYKPTTGTNRAVSFAMRPGVAIYGSFAGTETALSQRVLTGPLTTVLSGDIGTVGNVADNSYHVINNPAGLTSSAILDGCVITGGNANGVVNVSLQVRGGGMYNNEICSPLIRNCAFQGNSATNCGGAMFNERSSPTLTNCSFQGNSASAGGAMYNFAYSVGNSSPMLTNCSFQGNVGGVMFNNGYDGGTSSPMLINCVLFGNGGTQTFSNLEASVSASYSLFDASVTGYTGSNNVTVTVSPFVSPTSPALNACSPAINAGLNAAPGLSGITTDLAGNPRIVGSTVDMGAVEFQTTPNLPVAITAQPAAGSAVCVGSSVSVAVSVTGTVTAYQWLKDGSPVIGQTTATLLLSAVTTTDVGTYSLVITGACNTTTSNGFSLSLNTATGITAQPVAGSVVCVGGGVTASVSVSGMGPFTYQWLKGGSAVSPAQSTSLLTLNSVLPADAGEYTVAVTGACNATTSSAFSLSVSLPVSITAQPVAGSAVCVGGNVSASVGVGGTGPFTYQWYKDGTPLSPAQTNATLTLTNAQPGTAGSYQVAITGACTSATSTAYVLIVNSLPIATITAGGGGTLTCAQTTLVLTATGGATYQFAGPAGAASGITHQEASAGTATVNVAGTYSVTVISTAGCTSTATVTVEQNIAPPTVSISPTGGTLTCAQPMLTLTATTTGTSLRWSTNAVSPAIIVNTAGTYSVTATGANGCSAVSNNVTILLDQTPPTTTLTASGGGVLSVTNPVLTLTATPGGTAYRFSAGATQIGGSAGNTATVNLANTYSVTVTGANGCTATASVSVTTTATPGGTQTLCRNSAVVLTTALPATRYEWYKNGQTAANKLIDIASIQRGTTTASLTLVSIQTSATYYGKVIQANGSFLWIGPFVVNVNAGCSARIGQDEPGTLLTIQLTPNPLENNQLQATITGAGGQPLTVQFVDMQGRPLREQQWPVAAPAQPISWDVSGQDAGVYLLRATTNGQQQTIKVLKP